MKIKMLNTILAASLFLITTTAFGQYYAVGENISQETRDYQLQYCANETNPSTLGDLLVPDDGEPIRVLFINLFASW